MCRLWQALLGILVIMIAIMFILSGIAIVTVDLDNPFSPIVCLGFVAIGIGLGQIGFEAVTGRL